MLRERGLEGAKLATARCDTIRTKLLKIGAAVTVTVRKIWVQRASACPYHDVFARACQNLREWAATTVPPTTPPSVSETTTLLLVESG